MSDPAQHRAQSLHLTPLRYPGGKAKLAEFIKAVLKENRLVDGEYAEPYAGGAAIGVELVLHEYVSRAHINDISRPVYAFWKSVLDHTDELCGLIAQTKLTVTAWDRQKRIFKNAPDHNDIELGFATFFLNRTNRSGILNGGIIGGRDQTGPWKINARYNARDLIQRVQAIARMRDRIRVTRQDAIRFLKTGVKRWPKETLIYLDPPYYVKGRDLYHDFYDHADHEQVAKFIRTGIQNQHWLVTYDNVRPIRDLYSGCRYFVYDIGYSARAASQGSEVMFFCKGLAVPQLVGPVRVTADHATNLPHLS